MAQITVKYLYYGDRYGVVGDVYKAKGTPKRGALCLVLVSQ